MNINQNKEKTAKISDTELLRPGVVKIPYRSQGKRLDIIIYNDDNGFSIRVNELKNNVRKKIKDKENPLPKQISNLIKKDESDLMKNIGAILDHYIGKQRTRIPEKVREAYKLLTGKRWRDVLIKQKKTEIKKAIEHKKIDITPEEKTEIKKAFKGKSLKDIKEMIQINKNPVVTKIVKKICLGLGIITITASLIRAIRARAQKDTKNKRIYDTEQGIDKKKADDEQITEQETIDREEFQQNIPENKIQGVTYEEITNAINNIRKHEIQKKAINFIKIGNIIWLQEMYGMKKTSEYTSNQATGIIDQNTLKRIQNPLFGLSWEDVIHSTNIPDDVKEIYKEFLNGQISHENLSYLILSKKTCKEYFFDKNHMLIDTQPILIGADLGKRSAFMPYDHYKIGNGKKIYVRWETNRNTPTGLFKVKQVIEWLQSWYKVDGPKRGINIVPIDNEGNEEERFKYKQRWLALHAIYEPPSNPEKYEEAIQSSTIDDNSITHGCPNIPGFGIIYDQIEIGSKVYICTE